MNKFSQLARQSEKQPETFLFTGSYLKIKDIEGMEAILEKDCVVAIVHLVESNEILLRKEYIPTFKEVTGKEYHLTILSGGIEEGETDLEALRREMEEEAGIQLHSFYQGSKKWNQLFFHKGCTAQFHLFYAPLNSTDFVQVAPQGDGSEIEAKSSTVRIGINLLNSLNPSDTITALCLEYFRNEIK